MYDNSLVMLDFRHQCCHLLGSHLEHLAAAAPADALQLRVPHALNIHCLQHLREACSAHNLCLLLLDPNQHHIVVVLLLLLAVSSSASHAFCCSATLAAVLLARCYVQDLASAAPAGCLLEAFGGGICFSSLTAPLEISFKGGALLLLHAGCALA